MFINQVNTCLVVGVKICVMDDLSGPRVLIDWAETDIVIYEAFVMKFVMIHQTNMKQVIIASNALKIGKDGIQLSQTW